MSSISTESPRQALVRSRAEHDRSLTDPEGFWRDAARAILWRSEPDRVLDTSQAPFSRWFPDAHLNTCENALDRHVDAGNGARTALIHDSAVTGEVRRFSYLELRDVVARFAGALRSLGVEAGDRVVISMPMVPEAVVAMLACARLGAVHSVVFGGFAPKELALRIDDARPKVLVTASCGFEGQRLVEYYPLVQQALAIAHHHPLRTVVLQRPQHVVELDGTDVDWDLVVASSEPAACVSVAATDPLYVLYTSGTTGKPKGVVRDNGGHAVALAWSMTNIFGIGPGDVWWAASDVGWVVGHSYITYGPLLVGATTLMFEGKPVGTPDAGAFWRVVADHGVKAVLTAPTAIRAIRREDPDGALIGQHDLSTLRTLFLAGERLDPDTWAWAGAQLAIPVVDNWWQTETGWPIAANPVGLGAVPIKAGSPSVPMPGFDVRVVDANGGDVAAGTEGAIVLHLPLPPGALLSLWEDDERFVTSYLSAFRGQYLTGDGGYLDEDGYVFVMGRTDDVVNIAGHRLSTGSMEAALAGHPAVAECTVIGVPDALKGQVPRGLVVLKTGFGAAPGSEEKIKAELVARVRNEVGAVACLREIDVVAALPKTRSGKILRSALRSMAEGRDEPVPSTIEDPAVLETLRAVLAAH